MTLGKRLEAEWKALQIIFHVGVKSLGVGLGSGWYRNTQVMRARLNGLADRVHRFRQLRKLGVVTVCC